LGRLWPSSQNVERICRRKNALAYHVFDGEKSFSNLDVTIDEKKLPRPIETTFYVKPRVVRKVTSFRKVRVTLRGIMRVRDAVTVILKSADLPTSYVDSLPDEGDKEKVASAPTIDEPDVQDVPTGAGMHSTDMNRPLLRWLRDNVESARCQLAKSEPIRYEVERLQVNNFFIYWSGSFRYCERKGNNLVEDFNQTASEKTGEGGRRAAYGLIREC